MAIRWKPGEIDDLMSTIRRYNNKIRRLERNNVKLGQGSLPQRASKTKLNRMTSRRELNDLKRQMKNFLKPGSEELIKTPGGVVIPKYERAEINALNARINAQRRKDWLKSQEAKAAGDLPLMGRIRANAAKPRRPLSVVKPSDYAEYKRAAIKTGDPNYSALKKKEYRRNYYKMVDNLFGKDTQLSRSIKARLAKVPDDDLIEKTIETEDISFAMGSPPAKGADPTSSLMLKELTNTFYPQFRSIGKIINLDGMMSDTAIADVYDARAAFEERIAAIDAAEFWS